MIDGGGGICEDAAKNCYCVERQIDRLITCHSAAAYVNTKK
jgi:hypothetical protein